MKQRLEIILVVLSLLVALVGVAAAPMAAGTIRLAGVQYVPQKGPVFTFQVTGKFPRSALKGTLKVQGGGSYTLHCTQVDETTVKCTGPQKVGAVNASVTFGGSTFWVFVPGAPQEPEQYCYNIYDWDIDDVFADWKGYGTHCQITPAEYGELINWYNPDYEEAFDYEFMPEGPACSGIIENAYYFQWCLGDFEEEPAN